MSHRKIHGGTRTQALALLLAALGAACSRNVLHTGTTVPGRSASTSPSSTPVAVPAHPDGTCDPGRDPCMTSGESLCFDLQVTSSHCGACGVACTPGVPCEGGACRVVSCTEQLTVKILSLGDLGFGGNYQIALGDFDRDGALDLLMPASNALLAKEPGFPAYLQPDKRKVVVLHGQGDGTFAPGQMYGASPNPVSSARGGFPVAVADLNHDQISDMVVGLTLAVDAGTSPPNQVAMVARLGNGDGTFGPDMDVVGGATPDFIVLGDLDGDGVPDLASVSEPSPAVSIRHGNGDGSFGPPRDLAVGGVPWTVTMVDWNADGIPDLLAADYYVHVLLGTGQGSFAPTLDCALGLVGPMGMPGNGPPVLGDFDGDGRVDLVSNNSVLLGMRDCNYDRVTSFPVAYETSVPLTAGDFNGDGKTDLAIAYADGIGFLAGDGHGNLGTLVKLGIPDAEHGIPQLATGVAADFNSDGRLDLLVNQYTLRTFMNTCK